MRGPSWRALALVPAALCGCPAGQPAPDDERLLRKLKEESERLAAAGTPDPNEELARLAARGDRERARRLPQANPTVHLGTVAVKLVGVSSSHSISAGKLTLTTEATFLRVTLLAQNVGAGPTTLDFSFTRLEHEGQEVEMAHDAQRAAGTRPLHRTFPPDERSEIVLFFELPRGERGGWTLVLPAGVGGMGDVRIPLG
ncbi:MAG: hypothetical protein ACOZIN_10135 [Myxococcota bacterium]